MTYPPPQQPDPYGQQGPWGQQPQGPPSGAQPQAGYPSAPQQPGQAGPHAQPQYGQQQPGYDPYGQYGQYGASQPGYQAAPGGFPGGAPPQKKNKTGLIVGIAVAAVLLVGGGITTVVLIAAGGGPMAVAEKAIEALNTRNLDLAREVSCEPSDVPDLEQVPADAHWKITGEATINGDEATVPVKMTYKGETNTGDVELTKKNGEWCAG